MSLQSEISQENARGDTRATVALLILAALLALAAIPPTIQRIHPSPSQTETSFVGWLASFLPASAEKKEVLELVSKPLPPVEETKYRWSRLSGEYEELGVHVFRSGVVFMGVRIVSTSGGLEVRTLLSGFNQELEYRSSLFPGYLYEVVKYQAQSRSPKSVFAFRLRGGQIEEGVPK